jgi:hypothetical protein
MTAGTHALRLAAWRDRHARLAHLEPTPPLPLRPEHLDHLAHDQLIRQRMVQQVSRKLDGMLH